MKGLLYYWKFFNSNVTFNSTTNYLEMLNFYAF